LEVHVDHAELNENEVLGIGAKPAEAVEEGVHVDISHEP